MTFAGHLEDLPEEELFPKGSNIRYLGVLKGDDLARNYAETDVLINIGMVLGLMPVIGIPLPFFSYGGSSLWGFTFLLFIFLRIDAGRSGCKNSGFRY